LFMVTHRETKSKERFRIAATIADLELAAYSLTIAYKGRKVLPYRVVAPMLIQINRLVKRLHEQLRD
jgi:hypothetical protein